ncbi:SDR family oxidoreductase [Acidiferrimicrobium sp. IK]|uniref:SDR family oxidoreductase n=1 Tax=Acidiferrimicrobium sp. IK TaxID=2871700 RepID=UPI0021CAF6BD|nr:SDR family oxidoreductase [Acidiferrimicrobium sp. IK]MCU4184160.1 SDR family oxidoreductase [Acidiferrimicrobium sp. IK]
MILDLFRLDGKVAVVTGAGRGIGASTALAFAQAGADVVIAARTAANLEEVAASITALGRRAVVVAADLSDLDACAALAATAADAFGRLDIVVNNVGGAMPKALLDTSAAELSAALSFNVLTAHVLTVAAVPVMLDHGGGAVVNITSTMGRLPGRALAAYGTAKAALAHYTRLSAMDLCPKIRVNAIAPGAVHTDALEVVAANDEIRTALEKATPLRRMGRPEEVAAAAVYLASDAGRYLTGKVIEVDGGLIAPNLELPVPDL